jgi:aminoglycoside phosphotransferase
VESLVDSTTDCDIELNNVGWTSRVYIVAKGKFVFKFPRSAGAKKEYEQEVNILKLLKQINYKVHIPIICWIGDHYSYLGYKGIIGKTFDQIIKKLTIADKVLIGKKIGEFLVQLHSQKLKDAHTVTIQDEIIQFQDCYRDVRTTIANHYSTDEQKKLRTFIMEDMPKVINKLGCDYSLCHGDLGYWNLILREDNSIGVIDFGDIGYYDKSKDFLGIEDKEMLDSVLSIYGDNKILRQKIAIRQKALPLLDLVYFVKNNDNAKIIQTIEKLQYHIPGM